MLCSLVMVRTRASQTMLAKGAEGEALETSCVGFVWQLDREVIGKDGIS